MLGNATEKETCSLNRKSTTQGNRHPSTATNTTIHAKSTHLNQHTAPMQLMLALVDLRRLAAGLGLGLGLGLRLAC